MLFTSSPVLDNSKEPWLLGLRLVPIERPGQRVQTRVDAKRVPAGQPVDQEAPKRGEDQLAADDDRSIERAVTAARRARS